MVPPRRSPYQRVVVKGLVWEGHDHHTNRPGPVRNANQEFRMVQNAFQTYGYNVTTTPIPQNPSQRSNFPGWLQNRLTSFTSPGVSTLMIVYYQGHGGLDQHGHLVLSNGNGQFLHWSDIANAIINVRCDVLTILNCCHAGAALRSRVLSRPNYEGHQKQIMMAVPANFTTGWGYAAGFAACLEQALRDRRTNWENTFNGTPYHWVQAINRTMAMKRPGQQNVPVLVEHYVAPPPNAQQRPLILAPRTAC